MKRQQSHDPAQSAPPRFGRDELEAIGAQVRHLRQARGLSLRRLAAESGIGLGTLRKLEAGAGNPSLFTVASIAEALGVPLDTLIAAARARRVRASLTRNPEPDAAAVDLTRDLHEPRMRGRIVSLPPDSIVPAAAVAEGGAVFCLVLAGAVRPPLAGDGRPELRAGDALHAAALPPGGWANAGGQPARLLCLTDLRDRPAGGPAEGLP